MNGALDRVADINGTSGTAARACADCLGSDAKPARPTRPGVADEGRFALVALALPRGTLQAAGGVPSFAVRAVRVDRLFVGDLEHGLSLQRPSSPLLVPLPSLTNTYENNPDGIEAWKAMNRADRTIPIVFDHPFRTQRIHARALFAAAEDLAMRDCARRFGKQNALITSLTIQGAPVAQWCALYRPRADQTFSRIEVAHCNLLRAHLSEGGRINHLLHQTDLPSSNGDLVSDSCSALVTAEGRVLSTRPDFIFAVQPQ